MAKQLELDTPNFKPRLFGILLVVVAIALSGIFLVERFAELDYSRDVRSWQDKLNLIADSRVHEVSGWVDSRYSELKKLAENPSLQLYFTEIKAMPRPEDASDGAEEPPQRAYLRNLLIFTADRMGFAPSTVPLSLQIPAQIPFQSSNGIAVLDNENSLIVSTPYLTSLSDEVRDKLKQTPSGSTSLIDMHKTEDGKVLMGFTVPIFAIQADPNTSEQVGKIAALTTLDDSFYKLLKHPGATEKTLEAMLVRVEGDSIIYLTPLADGSVPFEKKVNNDAENLAEAYAIANPNGFAIKRDYQSNNVLVTGRSVPGTPWTLVLKIDRSEALAESDMRRSGMIALLLSILALFVAIVVAVWYVSSSRRAINASRHFKVMAEKNILQQRLLKLVTDNQPEAVYLLDNENRYRFVNKVAAENAGISADAMTGKSISDVIGPARAKSVIETAENASNSSESAVCVKREQEKEYERVIRSEFIPIAEIPFPGMRKNTSGVLVVEQDISEVVHEREAHLRAHQQLIDTLIMLVDKRDPNAANHSTLVSQIACEIASAMELSVEAVETARIAGLLMNIGKLVVPEHMLTRAESISDNQRNTIRKSIHISAELLRDIKFAGPVYETLHQAQEHIDGSGPQHLKGDDILITARIIAVSNAFIGMISPRSYRAAFSIEHATRLLLEAVDVKYDRKVVISLINFLENQGGREMLKSWDLMKGAA